MKDAPPSGLEAFLRALRFPEPTSRDLVLFLSGALALALAIWIGWRMTRGRRPAPPVGTPADPAQQRADYRVPMRLEAELLLPGNPESLPAWICEMSLGGATFILEQVRVPQGRIRVRFAEAESVLDLEAEVIRSDPSHWSKRHYLHCRFVDPSPEQKQQLQRIVTAREREILRRT